MKTINSHKLKENIKVFEVHNLKVYVFEKKQFSDILASFVINYGSNDISFKFEGEKDFKTYPLGIAHFLEHKMFDGDVKEGIFKKFSDIGADVNAYTSFNLTNYYFNTVDKLEEALSYLCEMIYGMKLTDENVESEKPIIDQEIRMYDDDPYNKVYRNLLNAMYDTHPVRNDIAGDIHTIRKINKEHLLDCYNSFYENNNMFLVLVGNVDAQNIKQILEKYVVNKVGKKVERKKFDSTNSVKNHYIEEKMNMNIPTNILGFKDTTPSDNYIKKLIIFEIIHKLYFRATSDFYEKIYKEEIIDGSYYTEYLNEKEYAHYLIVGDGDNFKKLPDTLFEYYSSYDFSKDKDAFYRIKKAMHGNYISMFDSLDNISQLMIRFLKRDACIFEYFEELEKVTFEEVTQTFKNIFRKENRVYSRIF